MLPLLSIKTEPNSEDMAPLRPIKTEPPETNIKVEVDLSPVEIKPAFIKKEPISPIKIEFEPEIIDSKVNVNKKKNKNKLAGIPPKTKIPSIQRRRFQNNVRLFLNRNTSTFLDNWRRNSLFKIGIYDKHHMCPEKLNKLRRALIISIMLSEGSGPSFYDCTEQNGWLQLSCKNKQSYIWLSDMVTQLKPWPQAQFRTRNVNSFGSIWIVTFFIPYDVINTPEEVVTLLKKQNIWLNVDEWLLSNVFYDLSYFKVEFKLTECQINELRMVDFKPMLGLDKAVIKMRIEF